MLRIHTVCFVTATAWAACLVGSSLAAPLAADAAFINGHIVTVDEAKPEATAIAWADGKIMVVGSDEQVLARTNDDTQVIDLAGRLVVPGFIESHAHFSSLGLAKMNLEFRDDTSWDSIVAKVRDAAQNVPAGQWILGRGWHQEKWTQPLERDVEGCPCHDKLSQASPNHPVVLTHASGHMCIANARAMQLAGMDQDTPNPEGGEILRDEHGQPTGVLRETAQRLVKRLSDRATDSEPIWRRAVELAGAACLAHGITSFHDAGASFDELDRYRRWAAEEQLPVRLWIMVRDEPARLRQQLADYRLVDRAGGFLTIRAVKQALDGALGAHGAWLLEPYDDLTTSIGLNTMPLDELERVANLAAELDFQLCVHAIGDRANREVLNLYQRTFAKYPRDESRRWRIEHAQHLHPEDIPRFGQLGVIAAMQGIHCTSDAPFVGLRLGQRRAATGAYMWRDLLDAQTIIANGTDAPVEDVSPLASFHASVARQTVSGVAFFPEQAMTRQEALRSYTLDAAFAAFEEDIKGSLTPGKLADLVVLSKNIMTCPAHEILNAKVDMTVIDGRLVYQREE